MSPGLHVLIAGGGIGGLAAALALLKRGIVNGSAENARRFQNRTLAEPAGAQEYVDREWSEGRVKQRYEWLFTYDVTAVAV